MAIFGNFVLMLALGLAAFGTIASLMAALMAKESLRLAARRSYVAVTILVVVAVLTLGYLLQTDAFQVVYVQRHSNVALPKIFKLTAVWAGSQGSLLWWTLILAIYTLFNLHFTRKAPRLMMSWAMFFIGLALVFFLLINNLVANPFYEWNRIMTDGTAELFKPMEGSGLNPQLQHWAMIIHPPLLYSGYIGFLFPFSMALGALITRMEGREWIRLIRRWTILAWIILGIGIILGGAWAYMELGWGGYWAWDPVENASFMPWLLATAFLHSVLAQETRGMFKVWNILLLVSTYLMCMFGTFITRSGLISSVHAFAESDIGNYFIIYILLNTVLALMVIIMRRDQLRDDNRLESGSSREVGLLFNNVIFISISVTMLLATIYPMVTEHFEGVKRELRHGFYNTVELPIFLGLLLMMAIGPVLTWKRTSGKQLRERFVVPTILGLIVAAIGFWLNQRSWMANLSFAVMTFLFITILHEFAIVVSRRMKRAKENPFTAFYSVLRQNQRRYGGYISHFAILVMALGLTGAAFNEQGKEELGIGETMTVAGYNFQIANIEEFNTPNFQSMRGTVNLIKEGKVLATYHPEQRIYHASQSQASEVSIGVTLTRDFYVVLAGPATDYTREHPRSVFHVYVNPLVIWIWIGGILMVIGTAVCLLPDKVRETVKVQESANAGETA